MTGRRATLLLSLAVIAPSPIRAQTAADSLLARADSLHQARSYPAAASAFEAALAAARAAGDRVGERQALFSLGSTYNVLGRSSDAKPLLAHALELAREAGDRTLEARVLHAYGTAHFNLAEHEPALALYRRALALAEETGDRERQGILWNAIGNLESRRGRYLEAVAALERALPLLPRALQTRVFSNLGTASARLARYEAALDAYAEGLALADSIGDRHARGLALNGTANVYAALGDNERAAEAYERALAIAREIGLKQGESVTLMNLAILDKKAGRLTAALERLDVALAIQREIEDRTGIGLTLVELADARLLRGDVAGALAAAREAVTLERATGQRKQEADALATLSDALRAAGEPGAAFAVADTARQVALEVGSPDQIARAEHRQARAARALGRGEEALALLVAATARIEAIRAALETDPGKIGFLEERQAPFHELVDLLVERGEPLAALAAAERARARAFVDLLAGRVEVARADDREALARLRAAEATARDDRPAGEGEDLLALRGGVVARAIEDVAREDPELASLVSVQAIDGPAILALAREAEATLVAYLAADSALYTWVVTPGGEVAIHREAWRREELRAAVEAVRRAWRRAIEARLDPATMAREELAALHARLVAPIADRLPADPDAIVYVIPHDALWLLPFAALEGDATGALVDRHALAYAPSTSVLAWLRARETTAEEGRGWLGVGDPAPRPDPGLAPLPWATREVATLARRHDADERVVLTGTDATEAAFRALAPDRAAIHLAAHGIISDRDPLASALALAPGGGHDGWLRTPEVFALDLDADLVVLSGCSTGLGKLSGEGMLGLSRAFLFAGPPTVVVSLWDVSDRATAELMDAFYAARERGLSPARAMRAAQRALRARYPHPFLWAAFAVIGVGG